MYSILTTKFVKKRKKEKRVCICNKILQSGVSGCEKRKIYTEFGRLKYKISLNNKVIFNQTKNIRKAYFGFCKVL